MKKSKILYGIGIVLTFLCLTLNSCKKETLPILSDAEQIQQAKDWYILQQRNQSSNITDSKGRRNKLIFDPNWEKAVIAKIEGKSVITAPVNTTLRNFDDGQTEYKLVIKFDGIKYEAKTLAVRDADNKKEILPPTKLYQLAFTSSERSMTGIDAAIKIFSTSFEEEKNVIYSPQGNTIISLKNNKLSGIPKVSASLCTSYFLITETFDSNNTITDTNVVFLGNFCSEINVVSIDWIDNGDGTYGGGSIYNYVDSRDTPELKAFELDYKSKMTASEITIFNSLTRFNQINYLINARSAQVTSRMMFPGDSEDNSKLNAFRHAFFSILNVRLLGLGLATQLGDAHENFSDNNPLSKEMDLWNNMVGRNAYFQSIGSSYTQDYTTAIYNLVINGNLKYITANGLVFTNQ